MIKAKTPLVKKPEEQEKVKFFTAENDIIPIRPVTHEMIMQLTEIKDEVIVNEQKVETLVKQHKTTNQFNKFFIRVGVYVDKLEKFLKDLKRGYINLITQQKILLESEKSDQLLRTYRAKREVKKILDEEKKSKKKSVNLDSSNTELLGALAAALGLGAVESAANMFGGTEVYGDVAKQGEFSVDTSGTNVRESPAWIPFPKGTSGLVYTSGYGTRNGRPHSGIDIAGPVGSPIITPISGVVTSAGDSGDNYGYKVVIKSGQLEMLFGHMYQQPSVVAGQQIQAGTKIGGIGSTGRSTGPHLHWNVYVNGSTVDPVPWTKANSPQTSTSGGRTNPNQTSLDPNSEGAFMSTRRIMVGEADPEFVIPMSKMPLFVQAIIEEKIKSINPFYQGSKGFDMGISKFFSVFNENFADGAIVIPYNQNHYISAKRLKSLFPEAKDYHIAAAMGNFETESMGMYPNRYQGDYSVPPTWTKPGDGPGRGIAQWEINHSGNNFNGRWSQGVKKYGPTLFTDISKQLQFVKWEMESNQRYLPWGAATKRDWLNSKNITDATLNFMQGYESPGTPHTDQRLARAKSFQRNIKKLLGITEKPDSNKENKINKESPLVTKDCKPGRRPKNIIEAIQQGVIIGNCKSKKTIENDPIFGKRADAQTNLNQIDGSVQMEVASAISNDMNYTNGMIDITYLYKPTVKIPVDLA